MPAAAADWKVQGRGPVSRRLEQAYVKDWFAKLPDLADGGVKVMTMEILAGPPG